MVIFLWFVVRLWEANANSWSKVPKVCCLRISIDVDTTSTVNLEKESISLGLV